MANIEIHKRAKTTDKIKMDGNGEVVSVSIEYIVFNAADENEAAQKVYRHVPKMQNELPLLSVSAVERITEKIYIVEVEYADETASSYSENIIDQPTLSFNCSRGSRHINIALSQQMFVADSERTRYYEKGLKIGWNGKDGDQEVYAGVDIPDPQFEEVYTLKMPISRVSSSQFKRKVADYYFKKNSKPFKGWDPGEVVFTGCSYQTPTKGAKYVMVSFHFAIQLNEENIKVGDITIDKKEGWDYFWAVPDPMNSEKIGACYIAQVTQARDLNDLLK